MRGRLAAAALALVLLAGCSAPAAELDSTSVPSPAVSSSTSTTAEGAVDAPPLEGIVPLADPATYEGESTAILTDTGITPVADAQPALPATVTSYSPEGEEQVTVTDASRVVAMDIAGSIAGTMVGLGLGDTIVGRDVAAEIPDLEDVPVVTGSSHSVNVEAILALEPTLVLTDGSIGPRRAVTQLADAGITVVFLNNESSFEGAAQLARDVAAVFGADDAGETLADSILADVAQTQDAIAQIAPAEPLRMAFVYLRGSADVYYLFGSDSGADHLFEALGGIDAGTEAGIEGEQPMTDEAMIAMNPDIIFVMSSGLESVGGVDGLLASKPAVGLTTAGQHRRFVDMADSQVLSFGPRSADILEALAVAVYAPVAS